MALRALTALEANILLNLSTGHGYSGMGTVWRAANLHAVVCAGRDHYGVALVQWQQQQLKRQRQYEQD
jgi:hypothetical protein